MLAVRDIMRTDVVTVQPDDTARALARVLSDSEIIMEYPSPQAQPFQMSFLSRSPRKKRRLLKIRDQLHLAIRPQRPKNLPKL